MATSSFDPRSVPEAPADAVGSRPRPPSEAPEPIPAQQAHVQLGTLTPVMTRREVHLVTERAFHVVDVTEHCAGLVADSHAQQGALTVFCPHTTCAVKINERETCFLEDLRLFIESLVPREAYYRHDDFEIRDPETLSNDPDTEPLNGHSHIKQMLLGSASESVPIVDGRLALGGWQRIMFIELDQSRRRHLQLQVTGWA
ncbi:MAG: hypothetical protein BRC32_03920 [Actinobacteria bacterium QS_8_72_14]|nr:MAG: hypothetical protein BRC32_03920 [Actinobacteria bacterium QS_8_72_14]